MDAVKIVLVCPDCGFDTWTIDEVNVYRCLSCGSTYYTEQMCPETESVETDY